MGLGHSFEELELWHRTRRQASGQLLSSPSEKNSHFGRTTIINVSTE